MQLFTKKWFFTTSITLKHPVIHIVASYDVIPHATLRFKEGVPSDVMPYHHARITQPISFTFESAEHCYRWLAQQQLPFVATMDIPGEWNPLFFQSISGQKRRIYSDMSSIPQLINYKQPILLSVTSMTARKQFAQFLKDHVQHIHNTHAWYALETRKKGQRVAHHKYLRSIESIITYMRKNPLNFWVLWIPFESLKIVTISP